MFWIYLMGAGERKEWGWSADGCLMMQLSVLYLMASLLFLNQLFINYMGSLGWVRGQALLVPSFIAISVMNWLGSVGQEQNRTERGTSEKEWVILRKRRRPPSLRSVWPCLLAHVPSGVEQAQANGGYKHRQRAIVAGFPWPASSSGGRQE